MLILFTTNLPLWPREEQSTHHPSRHKKKREELSFFSSVPPQVGRSPRSDGNVCGISHIHYRRSSSVLSTMLTLNNLLVLERKPIYLYLLFSATKVQLLFSFSMLLLQNIWLCNTSKIATIVVLFIRYQYFLNACGETYDSFTTITKG